MFSDRFYPGKSLFSSSIIYLLIFTFLLSLSGCETTKVSRETPEYLELFNNTKIQASKIIMKNGTFMDLTDELVYYYKNYKDTSDVLVFKNYDTIRTKENGKDVLKLRLKEKLVPLSSVQEVFIQRTEFDAGMTALLVLGVVVVSALTFFLIALASYSKSEHKSCPYVYSYDGEKYVYDAEPLGGAVCEGLSRTDFSRLDFTKPSEGKFKLLLRNENEEIQYLDEMKLTSVKHDNEKSVTIGQDNNFYQYTRVEQPITVTDENNRDVTVFFKDKDNVRWQTELPSDLKSASLTQKHKLHLRFRKPADTKSAKLVFYGGTAEWGSNMVKEFLKLRGSKLDEWYRSVYPGSPAQKELYNFMLGEELYYLKVNLKENGIYKHEATFKGGGPKADEEILVDVPFDKSDGEFIDIELNPPPCFWKIDRIGIAYDCEKIGDGNIMTSEAVYAYDKGCSNVLQKLGNIDRDYYMMEKAGNECRIEFSVPEGYNENSCALFLKTTGWYEIVMDKTGKPEEGLLASFVENPGSVLEYSRNLLIKKYENLALIYSNSYKESNGTR
ncbi:MAG: hypothetical protein LWX07_10500 [Bacteroidetes bacterium]|nr:hypothetical protein [Bacteroidota bacterium]